MSLPLACRVTRLRLHFTTTYWAAFSSTTIALHVRLYFAYTVAAMNMHFTSKPFVKPRVRYRRVLMNFQAYGGLWSVHFIEADCRSTIGNKTRYYDFVGLEDLRAFVQRCNPDPGEMEDFDHYVRAWGRGSIWVSLTDEQYTKLGGHPPRTGGRDGWHRT
jgi:hypothetical protein